MISCWLPSSSLTEMPGCRWRKPEQAGHEARSQGQKAANHDLAMEGVAEGLGALCEIAGMIE